MKFKYTEYEMGRRVITRPTLPITLQYRDVRIPVIDALVDTGADQTLLPLAFATQFGFKFDPQKDGERWSGAGGGKFRVFLAKEPIQFYVEQEGFRTIKWSGLVSFTLEQPIILLGHKGCLEYLDITCRGKQKILEVNAA